jgi:hypothetical protein
MSKLDYVRTLAPRHQLHTGPVYDWSPEKRRGLIGQLSPRYERRFASQHGRFLSGVDDVPKMDVQEEGEWDLDPTAELQALESEDDNLGSGIFDSHRHPGTANVDAGVFASHFSLPGYQARQTPFTVSRDVASLPSGADYVEVPAGGMAYIEEYGKQIWPRGTGHGVRPPQLEPAPPGGKYQTYAYMDGKMDQDGMTRAASPVGPEMRTELVRRQRPYPGPYEASHVTGHVALSPHAGVQQVPVAPRGRPMPYAPYARRVPQMSRVYPVEMTLPVRRGFGQEPATDRNWLVYGAVGLAVGAASAVVLAYLK